MGSLTICSFVKGLIYFWNFDSISCKILVEFDFLKIIWFTSDARHQLQGTLFEVLKIFVWRIIVRQAQKDGPFKDCCMEFCFFLRGICPFSTRSTRIFLTCSLIFSNFKTNTIRLVKMLSIISPQSLKKKLLTRTQKAKKFLSAWSKKK